MGNWEQATKLGSRRECPGVCFLPPCTNYRAPSAPRDTRPFHPPIAWEELGGSHECSAGPGSSGPTARGTGEPSLSRQMSMPRPREGRGQPAGLPNRASKVGAENVLTFLWAGMGQLAGLTVKFREVVHQV